MEIFQRRKNFEEVKIFFDDSFCVIDLQNADFAMKITFHLGDYIEIVWASDDQLEKLNLIKSFQEIYFKTNPRLQNHFL